MIELIFWEWDDDGKWLRFPLSINMTLICGEHRGSSSIRFNMPDSSTLTNTKETTGNGGSNASSGTSGRVRIDMIAQRMYHWPTNSCRAMRRTVVTTDLLCSLSSRMYSLAIDRSAANDLLMMLRANIKQRLIDDRSLAPSTGLLENALTAVLKSDPHALLMAATAARTTAAAATNASSPSTTPPASSSTATASIGKVAGSDGDLIAAQVLRDDMTQTVTNVTKLKVICQDRISVLSSLAEPLKWPPPPAPHPSATPSPTSITISSTTQQSGIGVSVATPSVVAPSIDMLPLQLPSSPSGNITLIDASSPSWGASRDNTNASMVSTPLSVPFITGNCPSPPVSPVPLTQTIAPIAIPPSPITSIATLSRRSTGTTASSGASTTTVASGIGNDEKETKAASDPITQMSIIAQRAETDFAAASIDDPLSATSGNTTTINLDGVNDLIHHMLNGPMTGDKHAELYRMWNRLVELRAQQQVSLLAMEPSWCSPFSDFSSSIGGVSHLGGIFKATQQFDHLIQTFANAVSIAETSIWSVFAPLRQSLRYINELIHIRIKAAREELERDIVKMELICSLYHDQLAVIFDTFTYLELSSIHLALICAIIPITMIGIEFLSNNVAVNTRMVR
jgi:hypothetical protein